MENKYISSTKNNFYDINYENFTAEIQLNKSTTRFIERAKYVELHLQDDSNINELWEEAKKSFKQ